MEWWWVYEAILVVCTFSKIGTNQLPEAIGTNKLPKAAINGAEAAICDVALVHQIFSPTMKLKSKERVGSRVKKSYHPLVVHLLMCWNSHQGRLL